MASPPPARSPVFAAPAEPGRARVVGAKVNLGIAVAVAVLCAVWVGKLGRAGLPWSVPLGVVLWLFIVSAIFLAVSVVSRFFGVAPKLPFVPARWCGHPRVVAVLAAIVAVVTALREGAFAPDFVLHLDWWKASHRLDHNVSSSFRSTTFDGASIALRGRPVVCTLTCGGDEVVCEAVDDLITCDDRPFVEGAVTVQIMARVPSPSCFTPLAKSHAGAYGADVNLAVNGPAGSKTGSLSVDGTVSLEMTGFAACFLFRRTLGEIVARDLIAVLDRTVAEQ